MYVNSIVLAGNLVSDPELKTSQKGVEMVSNTIAVARRFDKNTTDFVRFLCTRNDAKYLAQYGRKGAKICIRGELHMDTYTDKDGGKRQSAQVICDMISLDYANTVAKDGTAPAGKQNQSETDSENSSELDPDELPF